MTALILSMVLGCTSKITVNATPNNASIYITKQDYGNSAPMASTVPVMYEAKGEGSLSCNVDYFAWNKFYVYADAPGYKAQVVQVPGEVKVLPGVVAFCLCLPAGIWAYRLARTPINMELKPE